MIRYQIFIIVFLFCLNPVYANDRITISAPPSIWVQDQGDKLVGPIIDFLNEVFSEHKIAIESKALPWARAIEDMKSGRLDMIPVVFYSDERAEFMAFTLPYAEVPTSVFVAKGKRFQFNSLNDLKGKAGLIMRGDRISVEFEKMASTLQLTRIVTYEDILKMLINDRADYAVAAKYGFLIESKKMGCEDNIESLSLPISNNNLHFAFSKESPFVSYLPIINEKIKQMQADGRLQKIIDKTIHLAAGK